MKSGGEMVKERKRAREPRDFSGEKGFNGKKALENDAAHPAGLWSMAKPNTGKVNSMRVFNTFRLLLVALALLAIPAASQAQIAVGISVHIGPPALPVYVQPVCPAPGYIWTPGYWAYGEDGYYWVPGTWVMAPAVGLLWTPGYWGWGGGAYLWHAGYWGPHVGFYGGINYGFGYGGIGFVGGEWRGREFSYNRSVTNVNVTVVHNTYNRTVMNNNTTINRTSFNGGSGGTAAQPTAAEQATAREQHVQPTSAQSSHEHAASTNRAQLASVNHGQPMVAASAKPGVFSGKGVVAAKTVNSNRPSNTNNASTNRPGRNNTTAVNKSVANSNRNDRPPSAMNRGATTSKPNTTSSGNSNPARNAQNSTPANASGSTGLHSNRPVSPPQRQSAQHQSAPRPNSKPEHGKAERP
jgi:WXXGXW repeat (2 copies)